MSEPAVTARMTDWTDFDPTQGEITVEEAIAKTISTPEPWRSRLPELAKAGALDPILKLPTGKEIARKLPYWAEHHRGAAICLLRLSFPPGDCSFLARAVERMGSKQLLVMCAAMLGAHNPELMSQMRGVIALDKKKLGGFARRVSSEVGGDAAMIAALRGAMEGGVWTPSSKSGWDDLEDVLIEKKLRGALEWVGALRQSLVLSEALAAQPGSEIKKGSRARI